MTATSHPLEPGPAEMRAIGSAALAFVERFVEALPGAPADGVPGALDLAERLRELAPEDGTPFDELLPVIAEGAATSVDYTGPGPMAHIPGGGLWASAQIESTTVRWLCDLFGYPPGARGVLTSGGSLANLSALVTASLRATPGFELPWEPQLTVVPFRCRLSAGDPDGFDTRLLERINASGRVVMSSTTLRGRFVIRACILSHRTHRDRAEEAVDIVRSAARDLDGPNG